MDKLQPQTVYVPVPVKDQLPERNPMVKVMCLNEIGEPHISNSYALSTYARESYTHWLEKLPGVYPLTGKELADLLTEYEYSLHGNSTSFLKEKGVEI